MFKVQRSKLRAGNLKRRKSRGLSLVELIVFMVIVSAAVAGVLGVMNVTTRASADPMIHKQALAIAEAVLEEVQLQPFTYCDPDDPAARTVDSGGGAGAIAFDAATVKDGGSSSVPSLTWPHTVTSAGSARILIVGVGVDYNHTCCATVTGVTYGGVSMTVVPGGTSTNSGANRSELWYLVNPPTGSNNVVVTFSQNTEARAGATSYTGVNQTTPLGTAAVAQSDSGTPSVNVSSAAGELVVDHASMESTSAYFTSAGAGQALRYASHGTDGSGGSDNNVPIGGSSEPGAATVTMSWSASSSKDWSQVAVPLKPSTSACPTLAEAIGPEASESRYSTVLPFDNVNDYHGFDSNVAQSGLTGIRNIDSSLIDGLAGYRVTVSVAGQPLGAIGNDANGLPQSLLITVTVTGPGNTTVTLNGYRTRHAPNALP